MYALQEPIDDKLEAPSSSALKQEASSPDVAAAGAPTSNKVQYFNSLDAHCPIF